MTAWLVGVGVIAVLGLWVLRGWRWGAAAALASLAFSASGLLLAGLGYRPLGGWLAAVLQAPPAVSRVAAYVVILMLTQLVFMMAYRRLIGGRKRPVVKRLTRSRWLGATAALAEGVLLLAMALTFVAALPLDETIKRAAADTPVTRPLVVLGTHIQRLAALPSQDVTQTLTLLTVAPESQRTLDLGFTATAVEVDASAEERMLELVNRERTNRGLKALTLNQTARQVARQHSIDMFARGYFSHRTPEGLDPFDRMRAGGVRFRAAGENLALAPTLQLAHKGLMDSPGHRANILSENYGTVGIGIVVSRRHGLMVTQNFTN